MERLPSFIKSKNSLNSVKAKAIAFAGLSLVASLSLFACDSDKKMREVENTGIVTNSFKAIIDWNEPSLDKKGCDFNKGDRITTASEVELLSAPGTSEDFYDGLVVKATSDGCDVSYPTISQLRDNVQFDEPKK